MFRSYRYASIRARKIGEAIKSVVSPQDITNLRRDIAKVASNGERYDTSRRMVIKTVVPAQEGTLWKEGITESRMSIDEVIERSVLVQQIAPVCKLLYVNGNHKDLLRLCRQYIRDHILEAKNEEIIIFIANKAAQMEEFYTI